MIHQSAGLFISLNMQRTPFSGPMGAYCCLQNTCIVSECAFVGGSQVHWWFLQTLLFFIFWTMHSLIWAFVYITVPAAAHASAEMSTGEEEAVQGSKEMPQLRCRCLECNYYYLWSHRLSIAFTLAVCTHMCRRRADSEFSLALWG